MNRFLAKTLAKLNQLAAALIIGGGVFVFSSQIEENGIALTLFYIAVTVGAAGLVCGFVALLTLIEENQRTHIALLKDYINQGSVDRNEH